MVVVPQIRKIVRISKQKRRPTMETNKPLKTTLQVLQGEYAVLENTWEFKDLCVIQKQLQQRYALWEIHYLWVTFSETRAAGFLVPSSENIEAFISWLEI
jgi:hypothetical protein